MLPAGTEIELSTRSKAERGVITEAGTIEFGEHVYPTPSAAGTPVVGHSVDGWVTWRVPSLGNQSLADLRLALLERRAAEEGS